jgi:hypothetical protein
VYSFYWLLLEITWRGRNDWQSILNQRELNIKTLFECYFHTFNLQSLNKSQFYEIYYKSRDQINDKIHCWHIFENIKKVNIFTDEALEICKFMEEKVEIYEEDPNDLEMPKYPEYDPSTYPQYRFVEYKNYFTVRGFVKF